MFAKGPMPGLTPKADALEYWPGATCVKRYGAGLTYYAIHDAHGAQIATGGSASKAWENALAAGVRRRATDGAASDGGANK
jgi:hypothetical protein